MKRSEINAAIVYAAGLCEKNRIALPGFSRWNLEKWRAEKEKTDVMRKVMLGWDVTDFGTGDFKNSGAVLFTLRNGTPQGNGTPYAEKYMIFKGGQFIPFHYHYKKTEDIINRGVGFLTLILYHSNSDGTLNKKDDVDIYCDGRLVTVKAGEELSLGAGDSITLVPGVYHTLGSKAEDGDLVAGEVSSVNDDNIDNRFLESLGRFSRIEEDETILFPLCNETGKLV
jgi:D-lyxose ketol-isomerase